MSKRIRMFQDSSISRTMAVEVHAFAKNYKRIVVCLDSNHTHDTCWKSYETTHPW